MMKVSDIVHSVKQKQFRTRSFSARFGSRHGNSWTTSNGKSPLSTTTSGEQSGARVTASKAVSAWRHSLFYLVGVVGAAITLECELRAEIINGGLESGNLSGWTTVVAPQTQQGASARTISDTTFPNLTASEGNYFAQLRNIGPRSFSLQGPSMLQTFTAGAGDTLSIDYAVASFSIGAMGWAEGRIRLVRTRDNAVQSVVTTSSTAATPGWWNRVTVPITTAGDYQLVFSALAATDPSASFSAYYVEMGVDRVLHTPLSTSSNPILPTSVTPGNGVDPPIFTFNGASSGQWFDPPLASGYTYQMTSGALFTKILDFPSGFNQPFTVSVGGNVLGSFGPGQSVDFTGLPGGGVSSFQISGINPSVDPGDANAFPIKLLFNTNQADFTMQAVITVPEPGTRPLLAIAGFGGLAIRQRRMGRSG